MPVLVGTSGWQYADWKGAFYPEEIPKTRWLQEYCTHFRTLEVNNAFYRLPDRATFVSWRERTPPGFVIAVKASRYLTHVRRLRQPAEPVARMLERARGLEEKLGPVLLQLPPTLRLDTGALAETLDQFPADVRVAVELRHPSWFAEETSRVLRAHGAALCFADSPHFRTPHWRTADWGYLRLHEGRAAPAPCYGQQALHTWVDRLDALFGPKPTVYAYFNNDHLACAPRNALSFVRLLSRRGLC